MFVTKLLLICILCVLVSEQSRVDYLSNCENSSAEKNVCLVEYLNSRKSFFKDGATEPGLTLHDPLILPDLFANHSSQNLKAKAQLNGLTFFNFTNYHVIDYVESENSIFENIIIPNVTMTSYFKLDGKFFDTPLVGVGYFSVVFPVLHMKNTVKYKKLNKNGTEYLKIIDARVQFIIKDFIADVKGLGDEVNPLLNDNSKVLANDIALMYGKIYETYVKHKIVGTCKTENSYFISAFFI